MNNLPKVVADLVAAQNQFDALAYANCFAETAVVIDEGETYHGRAEIKDWIANANEKYQATMEPLEYSENEQTLKAEVSGNFPGSPLVLTYSYEIENDQIHSLKIV